MDLHSLCWWHSPKSKSCPTGQGSANLCHVDSHSSPCGQRKWPHTNLRIMTQSPGFLLIQMIMLQEVLKLCFRQCKPHIKILNVQQYSPVIFPVGGAGNTANCTLSACSRSGLVFTLPYPVTDPFQSSHQTFCHEQRHQNKA